jgi:hypothetical protein
MEGGTPPPALLNSVDHAADKPILEPRGAESELEAFAATAAPGRAA